MIPVLEFEDNSGLVVQLVRLNNNNKKKWQVWATDNTSWSNLSHFISFEAAEAFYWKMLHRDMSISKRETSNEKSSSNRGCHLSMGIGK